MRVAFADAAEATAAVEGNTYKLSDYVYSYTMEADSTRTVAVVISTVSAAQMKLRVDYVAIAHGAESANTMQSQNGVNAVNANCHTVVRDAAVVTSLFNADSSFKVTFAANALKQGSVVSAVVKPSNVAEGSVDYDINITVDGKIYDGDATVSLIAGYGLTGVEVQKDGTKVESAYDMYTGLVTFTAKSGKYTVKYSGKTDIKGVIVQGADEPFNNFQNALFTAATGIQDPVWFMVENYTVTAEDVTLEQNDGGWYCRYSDAKSGSSITYEFTADRNGFLCLDFNVTDRNSYTVSKNGVQLYSESLSLPQMIGVSSVAAGDTIQVKLTCKSGEDGNMTVKAAIADGSTFYNGYEILASSTLELTEFSSTYLEGTIACNRNGLLYTSIPQDGNWHVFVDGIEVEPTLIGDVMLGVYLTEGNHEIAFEYENKAFSYGWKISAACALVLVITAFAYHPGEKKGKYQK